jgi:hypothetical protein
MRTEDGTGPWSSLAYTLVSAGDERLTCLEASRSGVDGEPIGVLSRWGADPGPRLPARPRRAVDGPRHAGGRAARYVTVFTNGKDPGTGGVP